LSVEVLKLLLEYDWPGNVRELENYIERAVVLANGQDLTPDLLAPPGRGERRLPVPRARRTDLQGLVQNLVRARIHTVPAKEGGLYQRLVGGVERELIEQVLQLCNGVQVKAADRLGINRNTLHKKINDFAQESAASDHEVGNGEQSA